MYNIVKVSLSGRSFKTDTGIDETLLITNVSKSNLNGEIILHSNNFYS